MSHCVVPVSRLDMMDSCVSLLCDWSQEKASMPGIAKVLAGISREGLETHAIAQCCRQDFPNTFRTRAGTSLESIVFADSTPRSFYNRSRCVD